MDESAVLDQPTDVLDPIDEPQIDEPTAEPEAEVTEEQKVDGRKFNPKWSAALKDLRELHPEHADMFTKLRDETARMLALREFAPKGVEDVRSWKTAVDAVGGPEALADLQTRAASMDAIDGKILAGDDTVFDDLGEDLGKGLMQMAPAYLNRLQEQNPEKFWEAVGPHFQTRLAATGLGEHLKELYGLLGDNEAAKALVKKQYDWFNEQTSGAGKMPEGKTATPQQSAAEKELAAIRKNESENFVNGVGETAVKYLGDTFDKLAGVYVKQLNLSDSQKADLADSFRIKIVDQLANNTAFQKQIAAYGASKNRTAEQVNKYVQDNVDAYAKKTLDSLVTARYGATQGKRTTTAADPKPGVGTTNNGMLRIATRPADSDINWDAMEGRYDLTKQGIYILKTGKTVQHVK